MKILAFLVRYAPASLALAAVLGFASGAANTGLLAIAHRATETREATSDPVLMWAFVALCLISPGLRVCSQYLLVELGQRMVLEMRLRLARQILATPLPRLESLGSSRLVASLIDDVNGLADGFLAVPFLSYSLTISGCCLLYLAWLSPSLFLILLLVIGIGILSYQMPMVWGERLFQRARQEADHLFQYLRSLTEGIQELKLHRPRASAFMGSLEHCGREMYRLNIRSYTTFSAAANWGSMLFFVAIGVLVFGVSRWQEIEPTVLVGYMLVLIYIMTPLQGVVDSIPRFSRAGVALAKVESLGLTLVDEEVVQKGVEESLPPRPWGRLEFRGVSYAYEGENGGQGFQVGPLDAVFEPGELVFIVGGNGSGKTTFLKLLTGLYEPQAGEVRLGGELVGEQGREAYRQSFATIFESPHLFEGLLGIEHPELDREALRHLQELGLEKKVEIENGRFSTTSLSKGQRKRLALLTAYLEDRPVYVFDEWAADQDPAFREVFYCEILPELKKEGRTIFVISHDDRYYSQADRIFKLDLGQVTFDGAGEEFSMSSQEPRPQVLSS